MYMCVHEGRGKKEWEQEIRENVNAWKIRYARESTSDYKELTKNVCIKVRERHMSNDRDCQKGDNSRANGNHK